MSHKRSTSCCFIAILFLSIVGSSDVGAQYVVQPGMQTHVQQHPVMQQHMQHPQMAIGQPHQTIQQHPHMLLNQPVGGSCDHCGYSATNPPAQNQVARGRCQACNVGVDCADSCGRAQTIHDLHRYNFQPLAHGEWLGPIRTPSTIDYRIRPRDQLRFTFIQSQEVVPDSFKLNVGDEIQVRSLIDDSVAIGSLEKGALIQTDGTVYLEQIGGVPAAGKTIEQLEKDLEVAYAEYIKNPAISVIPVKTNSPLLSLIDSVDARAGVGGTSTADTVHSDGTIRLPRLGAICVVGMTLDEIKREVNLRYREIVAGLEVEPRIEVEAPHVATITGEVQTPGVIDLQAPTSVLAGIGRAGGPINQRANLRNIVIVRRAEDWRMLATVVDLASLHYGKVLTHPDDIWLRDGDIVIVPPKTVTRMADFIEEAFSRGVYGLFPLAQVGAGFEANAFAGN